MNNPAKLLPTDLIAVEVPKDATKFRIERHRSNEIYVIYETEKIRGCVKTGLVKFPEIIGEVTADEITFDASKLEKISLTSKEAQNLLNDRDKIDFRSLLQSNGLHFENPIGKKPNILRDSENSWNTEKYKQWQESESQVIKGKLVILKQV